MKLGFCLLVPAFEEEKEELQTVEKSDISVLTSTALIQRIDGIELRSPLTPPTGTNSNSPSLSDHVCVELFNFYSLTDDEQDYFNSNGVLLASSSIGLESFVPTNVETTPSCDSLIECKILCALLTIIEMVYYFLFKTNQKLHSGFAIS